MSIELKMLPPAHSRQRKLSPKEETEEHFGGVFVPSPLSIIAQPTQIIYCAMSPNHRDNAHFKIFAKNSLIARVASAKS